MDIKQLATEIAVFMSPFLPYLVPVGEAAGKEVGKKLGEAAWERAKSLWVKLQSLLQSDSKLDSAVVGLAEDPNDEDYQLILARSLANQLEASPELASELMNLIKNDKAVQEILVEQGSKVKDIHQRLSRTGRQEATVRGSQTGNITQEQ